MTAGESYVGPHGSLQQRDEQLGNVCSERVNDLLEMNTAVRVGNSSALTPVLRIAATLCVIFGWERSRISPYVGRVSCAPPHMYLDDVKCFV